MVIICAIFLFIFGAIFGSFVGAFTWRLHAHKDWVKGRSECEHCHHQLSPLDLIPVISWLSLGGRCRYCRKPIGWTALLLELGLGMAFVLSFYFLPPVFGITAPMLVQGYNLWITAALVVWLAMLVLMTALLVYDAKWHLLPNKIVYPLIGLSLIYSLIVGFAIEHLSFMDYLGNVLLGLLPITGLYGILWLFSRGRWIGLGDVKLGIAIGLCLHWTMGVAVLLLSNVLATLSVIPALIRHKVTANSQIAFGPFLIISFVLINLASPYLSRFINGLLF